MKALSDNADCKICDTSVTGHNGVYLKVGAGECLTKLPEGGSRDIATGQRDRELQTRNRSLPVENGYVNQVDTKFTAAQNYKTKKD